MILIGDTVDVLRQIVAGAFAELRGETTMHAFSTFIAQTWEAPAGDGKLVAQFNDLSIDAAREIARSAPMTGHVGRIMCNDADYCEVYATRNAGYRSGSSADTVICIGG